jgi:hypothetical protein
LSAPASEQKVPPFWEEAMSRLSTALVLAGLCLVASWSPAAVAPVAAAQAETAALAAAGDPAQLAPVEANENLAWAASVVQVDYLQNQTDGGAKLFGLAGGDPAMNGLYTYIAFFESPGDAWRVFRLGDFLSYRLLSDSPGRVDLEIQESTMNQQSGEIGSRTRHVIVSWTRGEDGAPPEAITVTPARQE